MTHLSTRILKPSQREIFRGKIHGIIGGYPCQPFSSFAESEKERLTQDTCGPTSEAMSGQLDLFGAFSRMSEVTPRWGYGESCPIWKKMVTERSSDCTQRRKQELPHQRIRCFILAKLPDSQAARDYKGTNSEDHVMNKSKGYKGHMNQLPNFIKYGMSNWPTPRAGNPGSRKPGTGGKILAEEAKKNWPTATTNDATGSKYQYSQGDHNKKVMKLCGAVEQHAGPPAPEKSSTSGKNHGSPKLNPNWVEQLMGLPIGWTDLGSWGMESSLKPQN